MRLLNYLVIEALNHLAAGLQNDSMNQSLDDSIAGILSMKTP
jgi:hypothetical protein